MRRFGLSFLFGMVLLVIGSSMAINFIVDLHLPLFQALIALVLTLWGLRLVSKAWAVNDREKVKSSGAVIVRPN